MLLFGVCFVLYFVNELAIDVLFGDVAPLAHAQFDCDLPPLPLHESLQVIITRNCDKKNGVVNGPRATVKLVQNKTVFLALPNGSVVTTHLVTCKKPNGSVKTTYLFVCAYSITICKSQGQRCKKSSSGWMQKRFQQERRTLRFES